MDISEKELVILKDLKTPRKAKELTRLGFSKSTVYRLLKELECKQLIKKEDGRYFITLLGKRVLESLNGAVRVHAGKVSLLAYDLNVFVAKQKGKEVKMKNWEAYYLDLVKYCVDATIQINLAEKTTVVVHLPEFRANSIIHAVLTVQNMIAKVRRALELEGVMLEEVERRKRRLKELEEKERKLLDELSKLGFPRGSIVTKFVKCGREGCGKCPHGPYYYLVYKEGGKTKWKYIGKVIDAMEAEKRKKAKAIVQRLKEIQREKKELERIDL